MPLGRLKLVFTFLLWTLLTPFAAVAAVYDVGPGKPYSNIGDVPWEYVQGGDQVLIHWRAEPYKEKWIIAVAGTETQPFLVSGIPNGSGELPVIDGREATTRAQLDYWNESRGVVKIGGANTPPVVEPSWITIENLEIRSGRPPFQYTSDAQLTTYSSNAASIYIESGRNITIRNCTLRDSGNGLFISHASRNILIEGNRIYDNGIEKSAYYHNAYTAALRITYQYNYFGPLRADCRGNNLKDRSAGTVVRYNWIEGGNRQLDLVDAEDSNILVEHPSYRRTFVYGNILLEPDGAGNSQIVHYGGDSSGQSSYRKGILYFYNNTVVSSRSNNTTLLRLSTNDERCDCRNNIIYVTSDGSRLALLSSSGVLDLTSNWVKHGWRGSHGTLTGQINDIGGMIEGDHPAFVDAGTSNFDLSAQSVCINKGSSLHPAALPLHDVVRHYVKHQSNEERPSDAALDIGAFETAPNGNPPLPPQNLRLVR